MPLLIYIFLSFFPNSHVLNMYGYNMVYHIHAYLSMWTGYCSVSFLLLDLMPASDFRAYVGTLPLDTILSRPGLCHCRPGVWLGTEACGGLGAPPLEACVLLHGCVYYVMITRLSVSSQWPDGTR